MGLSLSIGILIDDAIVVAENVVRHREMGKDQFTAAAEGTQEIFLAVMATTFTILAVFLPVGFMTGLVGQFFKSFALTVAFAVGMSLVIAFTLDPMLSSIWHDPQAEGKFSNNPLGWRLAWFHALMERFSAGYERLLGELGLRAGVQKQIASTVGVHASTISRDLAAILGGQAVSLPAA
jgi:HAE1 family hydrophobic/amphiphilic exporter-1